MGGREGRCRTYDGPFGAVGGEGVWGHGKVCVVMRYCDSRALRAARSQWVDSGIEVEWEARLKSLLVHSSCEY